jgi:two-component system cell cycle sensor histidine kinase/response regulator CckA
LSHSPQTSHRPDSSALLAAGEPRAAERSRLLDELISEGVYCFDLERPLSTALPVDQQVHQLLNHSYLAECNQALANLYGYSSSAALIGKRPIDLFVSTEMHSDAMLRRFILDGYRAVDVQTLEVSREGKPHYFLNRMFGVVADDKLMRWWGTQKNITAERLAEDARALRESRHSQMLDHLEQSIFMKDKNLRLVAANRRHCLSLGKTEAELIGKTDYDLYPHHLAEKYHADDLLVLTQDRKIEMEEQTMIRGELRTVRSVKTPIHDSLGNIVGVLGNFWDVTDLRAVEAQLRQAQKMDAIGQLASGVANDFNNMLTAMLGNLELLGRELDQANPLRAHYEAAEEAAIRAAELMAKLTSFSRRAPLKLAPTRLGALVSDVVDRLRHTLDPRIVVEKRLAPDAWPVNADGQLIEQALVNLCLNARDAMPAGGTLLVETMNQTVEEDYLRGRPQARPGDFVCLQVSDTGTGIQEAVRSQLFEPFVTTKTGGQNLGLGLAIVYSIVERHGGWIEFQTAANLGTTFSVFLPRHRVVEETRPAEAAPAPPAEHWGHQTILFVEDEEIIRRLGAAILSRHGYKVRLASDGHEALQIYAKDSAKVDLVVLDLSMPGLSGREVFRRLKAFNPGVKVLFTSGQVDELAAQAQEDPAQGCIGKPYRSEELARMVRAALDSSKKEADGHAHS